MENITSGDIIQGPRWPEPVQVELVEELNHGAYVRVVGVTRHTRMHVDQLLPRDEVAQLRHARVEVSFAASPRQVFLALETRRYRFASLYDPLLAMNTSKVDPLPHQIEAVSFKAEGVFGALLPFTIHAFGVHTAHRLQH